MCSGSSGSSSTRRTRREACPPGTPSCSSPTPPPASARAVLGARALTALRTAATTAVCVRALRPEPLGHVALVGTGVLARSHLAALAVHGPVRVLVAGRSAGSVAALVEWADQHAPTLEVLAAAGIEEACRDAGVVITLVSQRARGCRLDERWLRPDVLLLPLDYGTCVHAGLARGRLLLADDPEQFRVTRDAGGNLRGYRDPDAPSGAYLVGSRPPGGIVVQNLGTAIADLVLADAIVARAREFGRGRALAV